MTEPTYRIEITHDAAAKPATGAYDFRVIRLSDDRTVGQGYWQKSPDEARAAALEIVARLTGQEAKITLYATEAGIECAPPAITPESRRA